MTPVVILTTVGSTFDVGPLATELVEKRLAACVNVIPQIQSVYRFQGKIENDAEQLLLIKTVSERVEELKAVLFSRHPYDVPEFVVLSIDQIAPAYRSWLVESVS
jgi:periplasmic divalent cation tolerance protein